MPLGEMQQALCADACSPRHERAPEEAREVDVRLSREEAETCTERLHPHGFRVPAGTAVPLRQGSMNGDSTTRSDAWRCSSCAALLGRAHEGALEIRIKGAVYWTTGETRARCVRCGTCNTYAPAGAAK